MKDASVKGFWANNAIQMTQAWIRDGLKARGKEEAASALDVAEIVWKAMGLEEEKPAADVCAPPTA